MPQIQLIGQQLGRSPEIGAAQYVNWVPQKTLDNRLILVGSPGTRLVTTSYYGGSRGLHVMGDKLFAVYGATVVEYDSSYTPTVRGTLSTVSGKVYIEDNGHQALFVDGTNGYLWDSTAGTFVTLGAGFPSNPDTCTFLDGYFVVSSRDTGRYYYCTTPYDGATWSALGFNTAEASPDNLVSVLATFGMLYCFGTTTTEQWFNAGDPNTVFRRADGMTIQCGLAARDSVARVSETGNATIWLAGTPQGGGFVVVNVGGGQVQRVSTPEVEYIWSKYPSISDAVAYSYMEEGHSFYVLNFIQGLATWVYDFSTGLWHERSTNGTRHIGQNYARFNNLHLVDSISSGNLYSLENDTYTDAGGVYPIIRECVLPTLGEDDRRITYNSIQVDMERGVANAACEDPKLVIDYSDDRGRSWKGRRMVSIGKTGEYNTRVLTWQWGRGFRRNFRLTLSDPVKPVITNLTISAQ